MIEQLHELVRTDPPFVDNRLVDAGHDRYFAKLVRRLRPNHVVELGTGSGRTAAMIMAALQEFSRFTTVNWPNPPSGDDVGIELKPFKGDYRLRQIYGDTRDKSVVSIVGDGIDLLYIDSGTTHEYALIAAEWELYHPKLLNGAIVVCDDIHFAGSDMERFWEPLPYDKMEINLNGVVAGMFRYDRKLA